MRKKFSNWRIAVRILLHLACLSATCLLCVYWEDPYDWIKIPIALNAVFGSFDMFISRRTLRSKYSRVIISLCTGIYVILSYTIWTSPIEPEPVSETSIIEFNTSAIGECQLTKGSQYCFGDGVHGWLFATTKVEEFDSNAELGASTFDKLRDSNTDNFGLDEQEWEQCKAYITSAFCGTFFPMCDTSCQPTLLCYDMCSDILETCGETVKNLVLSYSPIIVSTSVSFGLLQEDAEQFVNTLLDTFRGCKVIYANESESLCMSLDRLYTTNLTGISPPGACTAENAVLYEKHLESLDFASFDSYLEALDQYHDDYRNLRHQKLFSTLSMLIMISSMEAVAYLLPRDKDLFFHAPFEAEFGFLSFYLRSRVFFIALLSGFLCYILHSIALEANLQRKSIAVLLFSTMSSGLIASEALFQQDQIASRYLRHRSLNEIQIPKKKRKEKGLFLLLRPYRMYVKWYKKYFSSQGKYEYWKYIVSESTEIALQTNIMFSLVKTEDINTVLIHVGVISINLIISPCLLLHPSPAIWRTLNRLVDSCLDITYLVLLYIALTTRDDTTVDSGGEVILGVVIPSFRLSLRLFYLNYTVIRDYTESTLHAGKSTGDSKEDEKLSGGFKGPQQIKKKFRIMIVAVFISCGLVLMVSTFYRTLSQRPFCREELGADAWDAIEVRVMFPEGLLQEISCNFESVKLLDMSQSSLIEVSSSLTKLVNLQVLNLSHNDLAQLPYELTEMQYLHTLDLSSNPVNDELDWSNLGIDEYPGSFFHMIGTLKSIDLSYNDISVIDDFPESSLQNLTHLDLSMNKLTMISANYIVSLMSLIFLNLSNNELDSLDDSIWSMTTLFSLDLRYNEFRAFSGIWATRRDGFVAEVKGNPVRHIDWSRSRTHDTITVLPDQLSDLSDLISFTASGQQVVELSGLISLKNLKLLNLSNSFVVPYVDLCLVKYQVYLDLSNLLDPYAFQEFHCIGGDFVPNSWNISGFPLDYFTHPNTSATNWTNVEHIVANNLVNSTYSNISTVLSSLERLQSLSIRNSRVTALDGSTIPKNLTYLDVRNTSMTLDYLETWLPDFNCTLPTPFVCTRTLDSSQ